MGIRNGNTPYMTVSYWFYKENNTKNKRKNISVTM